MRKEYEMTQEQFDAIILASRPVTMLALQCGTPKSPQENANMAWESLGRKLGFQYMTVRPGNKGNKLLFTAEENN